MIIFDLFQHDTSAMMHDTSSNLPFTYQSGCHHTCSPFGPLLSLHCPVRTLDADAASTSAASFNTQVVRITLGALQVIQQQHINADQSDSLHAVSAPSSISVHYALSSPDFSLISSTLQPYCCTLAASLFSNSTKLPNAYILIIPITRQFHANRL